MSSQDARSRCPVKMPVKMSGQDARGRDARSKCPVKMSSQDARLRCPVKMPGQEVRSRCPVKNKILSKIVYASPAWWGLMGREELLRIDSFLRHAEKLGYYPTNGKMFEELCLTADAKLF